MRRNRIIATVAAGLGVISLIPVATALGDDSSEPQGRSIEAVTALGSSFTYQGRLTDAGSPANGTYDLRFILYDADTAGASVGTTQTKDDVTVTNGLFGVELDFGAGAWNGDARWVEIAVRPGASAGTYTVLSPRQPISPTPYALFAKAAAGIAVPFAASGSLAGAPASTTGLFTVTQTGTGIAIAGNRTSTDVSEYPGVLGTNNGGGAGVQGESTAADGVGVRGYAIGAGGTGGYFYGETGLEIDGAIKVSGANPAAFVHIVDTAGPDRNTCPGDGGVHKANAATYLPVTDPTAIVLITPINVIEGVALTWYPAVAPAWCPGVTDRWVIFSTSGLEDSISAGSKFNVLVISK
ncbi:MAG: hypothetical protein IPI85_08330 [Dehalococcoidia bacterium]|nr:hypothetical protein [Dehalococcoidia bacterium]